MKSAIFAETVATADEITRNNVIYTPECLRDCVEQIQKLEYGVVYEPSLKSDYFAKIAFRIVGVTYEHPNLLATIQTLSTPYGEVAMKMLLGCHELMTLAMCVEVEDKDTQKQPSDPMVVRKCRVLRVSLIKKSDKAS